MQWSNLAKFNKIPQQINITFRILALWACPKHCLTFKMHDLAAARIKNPYIELLIIKVWLYIDGQKPDNDSVRSKKNCKQFWEGFWYTNSIDIRIMRSLHVLTLESQNTSINIWHYGTELILLYLTQAN